MQEPLARPDRGHDEADEPVCCLLRWRVLRAVQSLTEVWRLRRQADIGSQGKSRCPLGQRAIGQGGLTAGGACVARSTNASSARPWKGFSRNVAAARSVC